MKMKKNKKFRVLLASDCLSKNVKNAVLTYNSTQFKETDKKLLSNCLSQMIVNIVFLIRQDVIYVANAFCSKFSILIFTQSLVIVIKLSHSYLYGIPCSLIFLPKTLIQNKKALVLKFLSNLSLLNVKRLDILIIIFIRIEFY